MKKHVVVRQERKWRVSFVYHCDVSIFRQQNEKMCVLWAKNKNKSTLLYYNFSALYYKPQTTQSAIL